MTSEQPVHVTRTHPRDQAGHGRRDDEKRRPVPRWRRVVALVLVALTPLAWFLVLASLMLGRIDNTVGFQSAAVAGFVVLAAILPLTAGILCIPVRGPLPVVAAVLVPVVGAIGASQLFAADEQLRRQAVLPWSCGATAEQDLASVQSAIGGGSREGFDRGGYRDSGRCTGSGTVPASQAVAVDRATTAFVPAGAASRTMDPEGTVTVRGTTASGARVTVDVTTEDPDLGGVLVIIAVEDDGPGSS
jgi:hypothetical protein